MSKISRVSLLVVVLISPYNCWVINEIDFNVLMTKSNFNTEFNKDVSYEDFAMQKFNLIYPGTKWCGAGNDADGYDDLGSAKETDICCREHDNCPDIIPAGETKYNLTNDAFYTRLSCECDETFRKCLRSANSSTAKQIGTIYFNALSSKCYRKDYPVVGCIRHGGWLNRKCLEHSYDTSKEQLFQWFDVNNF